MAFLKFMHQNALTKAIDRDEEGWSPMCYAALRGDPLVMKGPWLKRDESFLVWSYDVLSVPCILYIYICVCVYVCVFFFKGVRPGVGR